jgi:DNA gyrase/topoisomerase IV subunit B
VFTRPGARAVASHFYSTAQNVSPLSPFHPFRLISCKMTIDNGSDIESDDFHGGSSEEENVIPKKKVLSAPSTNKAAPKEAPTMKFKKKVPMTAAVENEHTVAALGLTGIAKLDDAKFAGGARSTQRTLIVCEGDSAKSLVTQAMEGLSAVGRDFYGVFSLKGKPMNEHDAKTSAVNENEEIENLVKILGLQYGTVYDETNVETLRYGHLMIAADQNSDVSHIKGLIVDLIQRK